MQNSLLHRHPRRRHHVVAAVVVAIAAALGVSLYGGGAVERPGPPGGGLAEQLDALRGANDLVRASRADVGREPALYPTAYGRLEAVLPTGRRTGEPVPAIRPAALANLVRTDVLDTPAWRAHYVCLSLSGSKGPKAADAAIVLEQAGVREQAESEALAYLRAPDRRDDVLTSLATRAAFLSTLTCLGRAGEVSRAALDHLAADTARADQPVPVLYAVEALRAAGVRARATRALRGADVLLEGDCAGLDPIQRAALALLRQRLPQPTRDCLRAALHDSDPQTRWLARRALTVGASDSSPALLAPVSGIRSDGLVAKSPAQLGTLTATYNAARALTARAQQEQAPGWLKKRLRQMGSDRRLDPSDRVLLAMTCHRLALACGPQAERGVEEAGAMKVPVRLTAENQRGWYGAMAARAEFGLGCRHTSVELPTDEHLRLSSRSLRTVVVLADAGCAAQAARLTEGTDLVARARQALADGDLVTASDAVQAALVSDQSIPHAFWSELPGLLKRYRDVKFPDLYAPSPGGAASADATRAAYYLLA
ncbi:hypothetical protein K4749_06950 [Streptomyces sp. TRM72054]|uniref:hypothetical protein n=1 Tax=Streptomyces sp. TRM72054 TaxID=2870562 RepID=UPI001C8C7430|nr:hypothetical protein [Streptomyces sp. TRM72054]MBX9393333.1 hypothetical protein [Streptomyces sp. TRM72054]